MADSNNLNPDLTALQTDLAALRGDVADIMSHLKGSLADGAESASRQFDQVARDVASTVTKQGQQSIKWVGDEIEARPVLSLLIALGLGYIGGRLLTSSRQTLR